MWESRRLLDPAATLTPLDGFVRDRASQSLTHVFTLLSLVLPREPIQIAFRSLRSGDRHLRGTALEYLESVLPPAVRARICPYLVDRPIETGPERTRLISELLRSSGSQTLQTAARPAGRSPIAGFPSH